MFGYLPRAPFLPPNALPAPMTQTQATTATSCPGASYEVLGVGARAPGQGPGTQGLQDPRAPRSEHPPPDPHQTPQDNKKICHQTHPAAAARSRHRLDVERP